MVFQVEKEQPKYQRKYDAYSKEYTDYENRIKIIDSKIKRYESQVQQIELFKTTFNTSNALLKEWDSVVWVRTIDKVIISNTDISFMFKNGVQIKLQKL